MKPEQQRIALAEFDGWEHAIASKSNPISRHGMTLPNYFGPDVEAWWKKGIDGVYVSPPDYLNDLNAMHVVALKNTTHRTLYTMELRKIVRRDATPEMFDLDIGLIYDVFFYEATAAQRAEALLRTIGKWVDYE